MPGYSKHVVAFIDLLGFREAMRDHSRADLILQLLAKLVAFQGDYWATSEKLKNGRRSSVRPAISAFSDNIVISYPLEALAEHEMDEAGVAVFLVNIISYIAWNAFGSRLLVRGGIAVGPAYHAGGVVFGPALIEAYETERTLAHYPRVALAPSITQGESFPKWKGMVTKHDDGITILGYMFNFITRSEAAGGRFNTMVKPWIAEVRSVIRSEIASLEKEKNIRALSKWAWFQQNMEANIALMPPALIESDK